MIFYSLSVYALTSAWYNLKTYLMEHHIYVFGYVVVVGLVSFAVTYRMVRLDFNLNSLRWKRIVRKLSLGPVSYTF
jgi:hypothetical protein